MCESCGKKLRTVIMSDLGRPEFIRRLVSFCENASCPKFEDKGQFPTTITWSVR